MYRHCSPITVTFFLRHQEVGNTWAFLGWDGLKSENLIDTPKIKKVKSAESNLILPESSSRV